MTYYRISVPLAGRSFDDLCGELGGFLSVGGEGLDDSVLAYFHSLEYAKAAAAALGGSEPEEIADQNWSADLQGEWEPLLVGERFFLCPTWIPAAVPEGRILLEMVPGNVFGGGDHPTTQLCLELLEQVAGAGMRVADIGAGTGILTRAARALGARAYGCDIDPRSAGLVDWIGSADALAGGRFDGVIANIHVGVLHELRDDLLRLLRPGGWLLVSGFLPEQTAEVQAMFGPFSQLRERGGWCAGIQGR